MRHVRQLQEESQNRDSRANDGGCTSKVGGSTAGEWADGGCWWGHGDGVGAVGHGAVAEHKAGTCQAGSVGAMDDERTVSEKRAYACG